jgi:hypothetical protein
MLYHPRTWILNVLSLQTEVVKPEPNGDEHITLEGPEVTDDPATYMEEVYHQVPLKSSQTIPRGKVIFESPLNRLGLLVQVQYHSV